jgi:glyoxylase-like metal-dependent hydrolase (beta-lactamase superfamily II)
VGWNTRLVDGKWVPSFPNARHLFGRTEWDHLKKLHEAGDSHAMHLPDALQPVIDAGLADFIDADHDVCEEISLISTPGHTPGHVSVLIRSRGEEAVITGDLMHHPVQCAVPDRQANFDEDKDLACATRRKFLANYDARRALIIGSHFAEPTAGWFEKDGSAWKFIARKA